MTALLTAAEAAALHVGVNVIVRPGDHTCTSGKGLGMQGCKNVAPQDWVALTGPCPTCKGEKFVFWFDGKNHRRRCPDCRDGRRIVPLYTECPKCAPWDEQFYACDMCATAENPGGTCRLLVGRGIIEVVPVVTDAPGLQLDGRAVIVDEHGVWLSDGTPLSLDPLPTPGRDFGIAIDVTEIAT